MTKNESTSAVKVTEKPLESTESDVKVQSTAPTLESLLARIEALEASVIENSTLIANANPFVGFVLNNWEVRPALLIGGNGAEFDLVVFTKGEIDGAENQSGYVIHTNIKRNNQKHIPGTWHEFSEVEE